MTQPITIRLATKDDQQALTHLFRALQVHYWSEGAPTESEIASHVERDILKSTCEMAIAARGGEAIALATFAVLYPGPKLQGQLLMKDLFVVEAARGDGVGRAMLTYLAQLALARRCARLDWSAETDNPGALAFYDGLGARRVPEKVYFRVDGDNLLNWAANGAGATP